jgi:ATP-dependent RNA helicase DeaD
VKKIRITELTCSPEIIRGLNEMGFEETTPIQTQTIPVILEGKDVVGQAQTGTGKTAAFAIPVLEKINPKDRSTQALILCPTRELAIQIAEEFAKIGKYKENIKVLPVFGGQSIDRQILRLKKGVQVVIGTPGRIIDHLRRKTLKIKDLKIFVVDEADEMLNMGFREDIETILESATEDRQTLLFSATMPKEILAIINKFQKDPVEIKITRKELSTPNIKQTYVMIHEKDKLDVLGRFLDAYEPKRSIVFCNTKRQVDNITSDLQNRGYLTDKIHGDMTQMARLGVISKFKTGDIEILVATDVAARGLDINDVESVFNFDVPTHDEYYVHRIGRTGRAGKDGLAVSFVTMREFYY